VHFSFRLHLFSAAVLALSIAAQGQTAAPSQTNSTAQASQSDSSSSQSTVLGTLHGHITDQTGALIPGAQVTVLTSQGKTVRSAKADAAGGYSMRGLPPGSYVVQSEYQGFAPFVSAPIQLTAGQTKNVDVKMAVEAAQQQVVVTDEGAPQVSVEADANASAIVLKGKDLEALSDDPDELQNELQALAGPAAGPNGGQIYIDGFTGGQLPPKSAIREIRINQNPFSAEFDRLGYGRIEILTKPGTDKLHGRAFLQGNTDSFNTGNPFTKVLPSYNSLQYNGTLSGPISKNASFFFSADVRDNQNDSIYQATTGAFNGTQYASSILSGGVFTPSTHMNISPRVDIQLGPKNTLTLRYQFFRYNESDEFGGSVDLPDEAINEDIIEHAFQLSDSEVINDHIVNETRFQYLRDISSQTPLSTAPSISVPGYFASGGSTGQTEHDHTDHFELQNITTMTVGAHALKFGTRLRDNSDINTTDTYFNGSFNFASVADYVGQLDKLNGYACPVNPAANDPTACGTMNAPNKLTYYLGNENAQGNIFDGALFLQDDWKKNKNLTLSGGLRWETQNHLNDHSDWGPRVAFAYALDGHKSGTPKTVLRGGMGFFFTRLSIGTLMSAERYNGKPGSQQQYVINNPTCFDPNSLNNIDGGNPSQLASDCGAATAVAPQIDTISHSYRSPVDEQAGISLERQLGKAATLTTTYLHTLGVHQNATIDANAYLPGTYIYGDPSTGVRPYPSLGLIDETFPEAIYKQNQLIVSVNARLSPRLSVTGFYNSNWADSDTGTASNSYNISQDWGRASFVSRNQIFLMGNYTGPWALTFNPFLIAQSGRPFDIATSEDLTGDNFIGQDRPTWATAGSNSADVVNTPYGSFDVDPSASSQSETIIPANLGNGPAAVSFNLRVSRSFGIGPETESSAGPSGGGGGHGSHGGGFGGPFGGPFGGGGGRGGPGGGPFGSASTGRKYSLNFSAQALNLFNDIDYGTPNGTVTPGTDSRFGKSTSLAGGIFSSGSAARRVFLQMAFQF
jgi:Carboxypeptidase regulatory-like domain